MLRLLHVISLSNVGDSHSLLTIPLFRVSRLEYKKAAYYKIKNNNLFFKNILYTYNFEGSC